MKHHTEDGARSAIVARSLTRWGVVVVVLVGLSGLLPASIYTWAWNAINFLPLWFKCGWPLLCAALLFAAPRLCRLPERHEPRPFVAALLHLFVAVTFLYVYTHLHAVLPSLEGDGEFQPNLTWGVARTRDYLYALLQHFLPNASHDLLLNQFNMVAALVYVLIVAVTTFLMGGTYWWRLATLVYLCGNNAAGVFLRFNDNYACTMADYALWFAGVTWLIRAERKASVVSALILSALGIGLAYLSHPAGSFALLIVLFYCALRWQFLHRLLPHHIARHILAYALAAIVVLCIVKFMRGSVHQLVPGSLRPGESGIIPFFGKHVVYQSTMPALSLLAIAPLPWCLYLFVLNYRKGVSSPLLATVDFTFLGLLIVRYLMPTPTLGIWDYTALVGFGGFFLFASVWLLLPQTGVVPERLRTLVMTCACVLALFLYVPVLLLFSTSKEGVVKRCQLLFPSDRCPHNNLMSPYVHLGLAFGDIPGFAHLRIEQFARGAVCSNWPEFNSLNRMYLTAWLYEYGRRQEGALELERVLRSVPPQQWGFLLRPNPCFTKHAHWHIWDDAETIARRLATETRAPVYSELVRVIKDLRSKSPRPQ